MGANARAGKAVFNDVLEGNNDIGRALPSQAGGGHPLGCCEAKAGYDWASGWGSLNLPALARVPARATR